MKSRVFLGQTVASVPQCRAGSAPGCRSAFPRLCGTPPGPLPPLKSSAPAGPAAAFPTQPWVSGPWTGPWGPPQAPWAPAPASRPPPSACSQHWCPPSLQPAAGPSDQVNNPVLAFSPTFSLCWSALPFLPSSLLRSFSSSSLSN